MNSLILYLLMLAAGWAVGSKFMAKDKPYRWIGILQYAAIIILVFAMGMRIGADDRVIESLGSIGIYAVVMTVFAMVGSVLAVFLARKWMGLDRKGVKQDD